MANKIDLISVLGATASGKTGFAAHLAYRLKSEIISADSRQVYRRMDIGTGKDLSDYTVNGTVIPHHLIDLFEPGYKFNVFEYQEHFYDTYDKLKARNLTPVLCGGTGMYIEAVLKGYQLTKVPVDPELRSKLETKNKEELINDLKSYTALHNTTDTTSHKRLIRAVEIAKHQSEHNYKREQLPEINPLIIGIKFDRDSRRKRITERLHARLDEGMVNEVQALLDEGIAPDDLIFYGLEYKFITQHVTGQLTYDEMVQKLNTAIHQFAKRQMTWFRRMEKNGFEIHWLDGCIPLEEKLEKALLLAEGAV